MGVLVTAADVILLKALLNTDPVPPEGDAFHEVIELFAAAAGPCPVELEPAGVVGISKLLILGVTGALLSLMFAKALVLIKLGESDGVVAGADADEPMVVGGPVPSLPSSPQLDILTTFKGFPFGSLSACCSIILTTSIPSITLPKTTCLPSR